MIESKASINRSNEGSILINKTLGVYTMKEKKIVPKKEYDERVASLERAMERQRKPTHSLEHPKTSTTTPAHTDLM